MTSPETFEKRAVTADKSAAAVRARMEDFPVGVSDATIQEAENEIRHWENKARMWRDKANAARNAPPPLIPLGDIPKKANPPQPSNADKPSPARARAPAPANAGLSGMIFPNPPEMGEWVQVPSTNPILQALYARHYSCVNADRQNDPSMIAPFGACHHVCLLHGSGKAGCVYQRHTVGIHAGETYLMFYRNETGERGGPLLLQTEHFIPADWPRAGKTYVNTRKVGGDGKCFKVAGWKKSGRSPNRLIIFKKTFAPT